MTTISAARAAAHETLKFRGDHDFRTTLNTRVNAYFRESGVRKQDWPVIYAKAGLGLLWTAGSYALLVFAATAWYQAVPLAISLGLAVTFVQFTVGHDAGHGAISRYRLINAIGTRVLELAGFSAYVWMQRHNVMHHTYPNVHEYDSDIDVGVLGRFSPHQPHLWIHRFQHLYMWPLYGLNTIKWQFFDDFEPVLKGNLGQLRFRRPRGLELAGFVLGKLAFLCVAFLIPLALHPAWAVLGCYLLACTVNGLIFVSVVQLAHIVEPTETPLPGHDGEALDVDWAVHQVRTSCDFAKDNRWLSWCLGGLNFQIEHHLFPRLCHVHYPAIAPIVKATCEEHGLPYNTHGTFADGIKSHHRLLRRLGQGARGAGGEAGAFRAV